MQEDSEKVVIAHDIQHIAVIMDGNGRWAQHRSLSRTAGHYAGVRATRTVIEACKSNQIKNLTLFAFSSENWQRPKEEVSTLMKLFLNTLVKELAMMDKNNVCLRFIGDISAFSDKLQLRMQDSVDQTEDNDGLNLSIAMNYGGRWDILQATRSLAKKVQNGILEPRHITEKTIAQHLSLSDLPYPDLLIRTGNESRISNFLMWQLAYAELYFSDVLWPDFDEQQLQAAIQWFNQRQRRFGKIGEQIEEQDV